MWNRIGQVCLLLLTLTTVSVLAVRAGPAAGPGTVPEKLQAPRQNVLHYKSLAAGVQVYACKPTPGNPELFEWTLKAPVAMLWNEDGEQVGTHYAGPTWESTDGSKVVGMVVERANAPDPGAIPWLLLMTKSSDGAGLFTPVTYVQRLDTVGGIPPTDGCDRSTADAERAVEYAATYLFYVARGDAV
jgi:hypothetical protein